MAGLDLTIFCAAAAKDGNVYNVSQSDELAAIIPGRFTYDQLDSHNFVRDIVLVPNKGGVQKLMTGICCLTLCTLCLHSSLERWVGDLGS